MSVLSDLLSDQSHLTPQAARFLNAVVGLQEPPPPAKGRVFLMMLNYTVLGAFGTEGGALAEAAAFMALHAGEWTKTSPLMLQWFLRGVGHVEIVAHDVQG